MPKNIVICCDGTGNEFGENNTNVVVTYQVAKRSAGQVTFYDAGVGTGGWEYNESTGDISAISDKATGHGLQKNVEDAYKYLMQVYEEGDRIFLFGFSRGAFTVRALAGMLHKVGLLHSNAGNQLEYASKIYNQDMVSAQIAAEYKDTFGRHCPIHFIGVWDTVGSLKLSAGRKFHDTSLNSDVSHGYHAISIDERRKDFPVSLWKESTSADQTIEQVWFAGVHSDVGGWYEERGLANIALHWMLNKAVEKGLSVDFDLLTSQYPPDHQDEIHESYKKFWRFRGSKRRDIAEGSKIHRSVKRRMESVSKYSPKNLPSDIHWVD